MPVATCFSGGLAVWAVFLSGIGAAPPSPQPPTESALPIRLLGAIMDTAAPSRSACLVRCNYPGEAQQGTSLLSPGERACDIAEIEEVHQDAVVIKNLLTNRLELLTFANTRAAPSESASTRTEPPPAALRVLSKAPDLVSVELPKATVDHCLANLPDLLNSALATPRYQDPGNGRPTMEGFEISRIKEASIVERLGIRNGDVLLEVNGDKLNSLAAVMRLVGQVQGMAQAKLTVLRNGQRMTFVVNMK
jgi:general secretion pathway protein C